MARVKHPVDLIFYHGHDRLGITRVHSHFTTKLMRKANHRAKLFIIETRACRRVGFLSLRISAEFNEIDAILDLLAYFAEHVRFGTTQNALGRIRHSHIAWKIIGETTVGADVSSRRAYSRAGKHSVVDGIANCNTDIIGSTRVNYWVYSTLGALARVPRGANRMPR